MQNVNRRLPVVCTFLLLIVSTSSWAENTSFKIKSGQYEELLLAVDEKGHLTGYYHEEQGDHPSKSCSFYLAGQVADGVSSVTTWSKSTLNGKLTARVDGVSLQIEKGREHTGCGLVLLPEIDNGLNLDRVVSADWLELRKVSMPIVHFHAQPDTNQELKAYVVAENIVGVTARKGDWLEVEYQGAKHSTKGWIPVNSTLPLTPP